VIRKGSVVMMLWCSGAMIVMVGWGLSFGSSVVTASLLVDVGW